ncbi:MAG: Ax21 family protein [Pseudomonadota bacterium]|nr:Ax21 family protein [Pseudomonadota bacterium]
MKRSLPALTLLAALPFAATAAEGLSYTYVEAGYAATDTDFGDADGFAINGSAAVAPNFHVFGGYNGQETDDFDIGGTRFPGVDVDQWRVGVGYNHAVAPNTDLLTRVAYERAEVVNESFDGYSVEAGVRSALTPMLEGYALAGYEDGSDFDGDFYGRVGGQVKFNQTWGVSGDVKFADGDTQYFIGPRITF